MEERKNINIDRLVNEYYDGTISSDGLDTLRSLVNKETISDPELIVLKDIFRFESDIVASLEQSVPDGLEETIMSRIHQRGKIFGFTMRKRLFRFSIAASVIGLICAGSLFFINHRTSQFSSGKLAYSTGIGLNGGNISKEVYSCILYTSPIQRDAHEYPMPT